MANNAFDNMNNAAGSDMYITGGAITSSEYEQNMTPSDQSEYEALLMEEFMAAYASDPHKRNLSFKSWLKSLNFNLLEERANKYNEVMGEDNGSRKLYQMEDSRILEDAGILQRLAHLHTGRIEDIAKIVSDMEPQMPSEDIQPSSLRRPEASAPIDG